MGDTKMNEFQTAVTFHDVVEQCPCALSSDCATVEHVQCARDMAFAFLQVQHARIAGDTQKTTWSHWSEVLRGCLASLPSNDVQVVDSLWQLTSCVMRIHEGDRLAAAHDVVAWHYRTQLTDHEQECIQLIQKHDTFLTQEEWDRYFGFAFLRLLSGDLPGCGRMLAAAKTRIRDRGYPITSAQESLVTDALQLLIEPFMSSDEFVAWAKYADVVMHRERELLQYADAPQQDPHGWGTFCGALVDITAMCTGDEEQIYQTVHSLGLSPLWDVVGVLSLVRPFAALPEICTLLEHRLTAMPNHDWFEEAVLWLLSCQRPYDVVDVMDRMLGAIPLLSFSADAVLSFKMMAAHVADVCAPPFLASGADALSALHMRNQLVVQYAEYIGHHSYLWDTAATYVAFSPLCDPQSMVALLEGTIGIICSHSAPSTAHSRYVDVKRVYDALLAPSSVAVTQVRDCCKLRGPAATSTIAVPHPVAALFRAYDELVPESFSAVTCAFLQFLSEQNQCPLAISVSVEMGEWTWAKKQLHSLVNSPAANGSLNPQFVAIGEAVRSGLITLDPTGMGSSARRNESGASVVKLVRDVTAYLLVAAAAADVGCSGDSSNSEVARVMKGVVQLMSLDTVELPPSVITSFAQCGLQAYRNLTTQISAVVPAEQDDAASAPDPADLLRIVTRVSLDAQSDTPANIDEYSAGIQSSLIHALVRHHAQA